MTIIPLSTGLTFASVYDAKSVATNNTASPGLDTQQYVGQLAVVVNIGVKTAGDNDGAVTVQIQGSATNSAANATNIASTVSTAATTNNTAATAAVIFDKRAEFRYLFARITLAGTNSPAYPVSVVAVGQKQVQ